MKSLLGSKNARNLLLTTNDLQETPLLLAINMNNVEAVKLILKAYISTKTDINSKDKEGNTIAHLAFQKAVHLKAVVPLLQFKDLLVHVENQRSDTPLHYFCRYFADTSSSDLFKKVWQLLLQKGAQVNFENCSKETALHRAMLNPTIDAATIVVKSLLKNGANINTPNKRGETAIHFACRMDKEKLVVLLAGRGADVNVKTSDGKTPYDLAVENNNVNAAHCLKLISKGILVD